MSFVVVRPVNNVRLGWPGLDQREVSDLAPFADRIVGGWPVNKGDHFRSPGFAAINLSE